MSDDISKQNDKNGIINKTKNIFNYHKITFLKFALIGGLATVINYGIFFILYKFLSVNYLLSSAVGYMSGVFVGFNLNKKFTFKYQSGNTTLEAIKYLMIYSASLFMGLILLRLLVYLGINVLLANLLTIGFTTMTNYFGSRYFVFYDSEINKTINYWIYRYRYLSLYIIIGLSSIIIEILVISLLNKIISSFLIKAVIGFVFSMGFSFILNSKLNFKVPKERNARTFRIFTIISVFAFSLNLLLISFVLTKFLLLQYSIARFISAGIIFMVSYSLHRRFTFMDIKNVGIAVYLSESEDVRSIKNKISYYPDWIHLDLVDKTFNKSAKQVDISKGYESKKYWPRLKFMTHIMSKNPSQWIEKVAPFSDYIIIQLEIEENVDEIITNIRKLNKKPGLTLLPSTRLEDLNNYLGKVDIIQVLGIHNVGQSGQQIDESTITKLNELNRIKHQKKLKFDISFDGGVKFDNINKINAKYIVSGSTVLNSEESVKAIFTLKTSSKYQYKDEEHKK
jgi:ribulose-phosphate 3-epimerase